MVYNWLPFPHAFHGLHVSLRFSRATCFLHFSLSYTCFPTLASSYMFSHICHWLHVFPNYPLASCFPTLSTGYMFSHVHLPLTTCFPTVVTGYKFSRASQWLHVFPLSCSPRLQWVTILNFFRLSMAACFPSLAAGYIFSRPCQWFHFFLCFFELNTMFSPIIHGLHAFSH